MTTHPKPARVDLGDGDSLFLFRTDDWHTTVRFHSANPNTSLAGAVMATDALRDALDDIAPVQEAEDEQSGSDFWCERWAEAACQRDDAQAYAALWKETARRLSQERRAYRSDAKFEEARADGLATAYHDAREKRVKAERERDQWRDAAQARMGQRAEQPRPLTADDIPVMIERIRVGKIASTYRHVEEYYGDLLTIALDLAPSRPEGAEEIEAWLDGMPEAIRLDGDEHQRLFANHLAHMGFRVPVALAEVGLTENTEKEKDR